MKKHNAYPRKMRLLFCCYGILMVYLLFIRNRTAVSGVPYWEQVAGNWNFEPLRTIGNYWDVLSRGEYYLEKWGSYAQYRLQARYALINLLGNVIMFVPLGIFLPGLFGKKHKGFKTLFAGMGIILVVEAIQLFSLRGKCDVDDMILNIAGIFLGYLLWLIFAHRPRKRKNR